MIKIAINGFGRIGRTLTRVIQNHPEIKLVAINDIAPYETLAHLLKYDSIHGRFPGTVELGNKSIIINDNAVYCYHSTDPSGLPWDELEIDVVIESTGHFKTTESASSHLKAGAKKVIISAPPTDETKTIVLGINDHLLSADDLIVSNASCTTNSAAPLVKLLQENWGIEQAYITTVHSYTSDQRLHDAPHKDLRRARAATQSMVPTSTGAAKAITKIFPELDGIIGGAGIRVPVPNGSLTDLSCIIKSDVSISEINQKFFEASQNELKGILEYTEDPIVSSDIVGNPHSCIFDGLLTSVLGRMVKVVGWYDNEWGYSSRLAELVKRMA